MSAADYLLAIQDLQAFSRTVARFFTEVDLWLTPTLAAPPLPLAEAAASASFIAFPAWVANATGNPAMSVPLSWNGEGLPIGVHFLGRFGDEATLLRWPPSSRRRGHGQSGHQRSSRVQPTAFACKWDRSNEPRGFFNGLDRSKPHDRQCTIQVRGSVSKLAHPVCGTSPLTDRGMRLPATEPV